MALPTKPGNAERGWNDPPQFLHTDDQSSPAAMAGPPPRRSILNKRVAHPAVPLPAAGLPTAKPSGCGVVLLPPAPSIDIPRFTAPIIVPTMSPTEESPVALGTMAMNPITNTQVNTEQRDDELQIPDFDNDEQMYHFVLTRLQKTCVTCSSLLKPKAVDDINRKLDIFSKMWKDGKISYPVKSSMARLATAVHRRKCDLAHDIHLSLMMDFVSEVGQWMVGIKRLIQEARGMEPPMSPTDNTCGPSLTSATPDEHLPDTTDADSVTISNSPKNTVHHDNLTEVEKEQAEINNSSGEMKQKCDKDSKIDPDQEKTEPRHLDEPDTLEESADSPAIIETSPIQS